MLVSIPTESSYSLPEGALCRSDVGWIPRLYRVTINIPTKEKGIADVLEVLQQQEGNLLGTGSLDFVSENVAGTETPAGRTYSGYLVFIPQEDNDFTN